MFNYSDIFTRIPKVFLSDEANPYDNKEIQINCTDEDGNTNGMALVNPKGVRLLNTINKTPFRDGEFKATRLDVEPPRVEFLKVKPVKTLHWYYALRRTADGCMALAAVNTETDEIVENGWLIKFMKNKGIYLYHTLNPKLGFRTDAHGRMLIIL